MVHSLLLGVVAMAMTSATDLDAALAGTDPVLAAGAALAAVDDARRRPDDRAAVSAVVDTLIKRSRSPLVRDLAHTIRAAERLGAFDISGAAEDLDALGGPRTLRCVGPFANTGGSAFATTTPADDVQGTLDQDVDGLDRPVRWTTIEREPRGGFDIDDRFVARNEVRARCAVVVTSRTPQLVALRTASSGPLVVWQGAPRAEVLRDDAKHPSGFDQGVALLSLPAGKTLLVAELSLLGGGGVLHLRLTRPDGSPLSGLTWSTTDADIKAANRPAPALPARRPVAADLTIDTTRLKDPAYARAATRVLNRTHDFDDRQRPTRLSTTMQAWTKAAADGDDRAAALVASAASHLDDDPTTAARMLLEAASFDNLTPAVRGDVLAMTARLRVSQGDAVGASAMWREARQAAPGRIDIIVEALEFERRRGVLGTIVDREIMTLAQNAAHTPLLLLAANVLEERGDVSGARALSQHAGDASAVSLRDIGMLEARLGTDATARAALLAELGRRLDVYPSSHSIAERLALLALDGGDLAAAQGLAEGRRRRYPERPEPRRLLAQIALLSGDRADALKHLQGALALTPDDGELQRTVKVLRRDDENADDDLATRLLPPFTDEVLAAARSTPPPGSQNNGAFIHSKAIATRFFENGNLQRVEDTVVVIVDARKASGMRSFNFGYTGGREQLDVLTAERISSDGRRENPQRIVDRGQDGKENGAYSDARAKTAIFSSVEDGDVIHLRIRKETTGLQNQFGDFFGDLEVLESGLPTRHFRLTIEGPTTRKLFIGGRDPPPATITTAGNVTTWAFAADDIAPLVGEGGMPPWLEVARFISVSTYGTWAELGVWYEALIGDQLRLDDDLREVVATIKQQSTGPEDLVRRIYEHVVTSTRYVGIELGIHGWKPYPVSEVYRRRFGDCKDKASLLVAMLREAGIKAHVALVRTIQQGHTAESPPSMWAFNHAIAWVEDFDLFLDGTAERSGYRELPTMDQGAWSLIVDGAATRLVTIPVAQAAANENTSSYTLRLQPDGALLVDGDEQFRGSHNSRERARFEDESLRQATLERELAQYIPGAHITALSVSSLALAADQISYHFGAVLPKRAVVESDGSLILPVSLYPHDLTGNYAESSSRRYELFVDHPWRTRNVMRYVLPPGMVVEDLPAGGDVDNEHVRFRQVITRTADGFIVDEDTTFLSRRVPVAAYPAFRDAALAADRLMKRRIRITPAAGARP